MSLNLPDGRSCCCRSTPTSLAALVVTFVLASLASSAPPPPPPNGHNDHVHLPGGARVLASAVHDIVPHLPLRQVASAVYEYDAAANHLLIASTPTTASDESRHHFPPIHVLAPAVHQLIPDEPIGVHVDGQRQRADYDAGPIVRRGAGFTFVYDRDDPRILLAAWGPAFSLRPLDTVRYPRVFVNRLHGKPLLNASADMHLPAEGDAATAQPLADNFGAADNTLQQPRGHMYHMEQNLTTVAQPGSASSRQQGGNAPPSSTTNRGRHDFSIILSYGADFNNIYGHPRTTNQVLHAMFEEMRLLFAPTKVYPALRDMHVMLHSNAVSRPSNLNDCPVDSFACSRPAMLLDHYRAHWMRDRQRTLRDAVYVVSGYDDGTPAIGAAYVGAACNNDFAYGWLQFEHGVLFAHEVAHTLGAHHSEQGIMRPYLDLEEPAPRFSDETVESIDAFIDSTSSSRCLSSWDRYYSRRGDDTGTLLELRMSDVQVESSDVTIGVRGTTRPRHDLFMLHVGTEPGMVHLYYSAVLNLRMQQQRRGQPEGSGSGGMYQYSSWEGLFQIPDTHARHVVGGGLAFGNVRSNTSRDLVVVYARGREEVVYKVGFGLSARTGRIAARDWSDTYSARVMNARQPLQCLGATLADVRGVGKLDLVIMMVVATEGVNYGEYIIGWDVGPDGQVRGGWSPKFRMRGWFGRETGDVSVEVFDTSGTGMPDLVVYSNERVTSDWRGVFRIGRALDARGIVTDMWSTAIPAPGSPLVSVMPDVTGGVAIAKFGSGRNAQPTTVMLESVTFPATREIVNYLQFDFDVVQASRDESASTHVQNAVQDPERKCAQCYDGAMEGFCTRKFAFCEGTAHAFPVDSDAGNTTTAAAARTVVRQAVAADGGGGAEPAGLTPEDTLYCNGFHNLFVDYGSDACRTDVGMEQLYAEGTSEIVERELSTALPGQTISLDYTLQMEDDKLNGSSVLSGRDRRNVSIRITIRTGRVTRRLVIRRAMERLRQRPDFTRVYEDKAPVIRVDRRNGRLFFVTMNFSSYF